MRILVTGGAGFIGTHLCKRLLRDGHDVICMDNLLTSRKSAMVDLLRDSCFEFVRHDVCDPWQIECDRVYHLACPASPVHYSRNPVQTIRTAFMGTMHALQCARDARARMLVTSTSEIYGDPTVSPQPETYWGNVNPVGPRACYDEGKRAGEALCVSWAQQYGTDVRIARLFNTYGPGMASDDGRLIPNFIVQALRGEPITVYGDGAQTRSFCFVSDTVECLVRMMEAPPGGEVPILNVGNPDERTISSVAESVLRLARRRSDDVRHVGLPTDDPRQRRPDTARVTRALAWTPAVSFDTGLHQTYEWFRTILNTET